MARGSKRSHQEYVTEVTDLVGDEYLVVGQYINSRTRLNIKHQKCGTTETILPSDFLRGRRCQKCRYKKVVSTALKTNEQFISQVKDMVGSEYVFLERYINASTEISVQHSKCENIYKTRPSNFLRGRGCPNCERRKKKSTSDFSKDVSSQTNGEYALLGDYILNAEKVTIHHITCGNKYRVAPYNFLKGERCPRCSSSKGENGIRLFLETNDIEYKQQFKFKDCVDKRELPFDFAVFSASNLQVLLEYDGEQHYNAVNHFGGESALSEIKRRDDIKTQYCLDKNIQLIRIPYWELENIKVILKDKLLPLLSKGET